MYHNFADNMQVLSGSVKTAGKLASFLLCVPLPIHAPGVCAQHMTAAFARPAGSEASQRPSPSPPTSFKPYFATGNVLSQHLTRGGTLDMCRLDISWTRPSRYLGHPSHRIVLLNNLRKTQVGIEKLFREPSVRPTDLGGAFRFERRQPSLCPRPAQAAAAP